MFFEAFEKEDEFLHVFRVVEPVPGKMDFHRSAVQLCAQIGQAEQFIGSEQDMLDPGHVGQGFDRVHLINESLSARDFLEMLGLIDEEGSGTPLTETGFESPAKIRDRRPLRPEMGLVRSCRIQHEVRIEFFVDKGLVQGLQSANVIISPVEPGISRRDSLNQCDRNGSRTSRKLPIEGFQIVLQPMGECRLAPAGGPVNKGQRTGVRIHDGDEKLIPRPGKVPVSKLLSPEILDPLFRRGGWEGTFVREIESHLKLLQGSRGSFASPSKRFDDSAQIFFLGKRIRTMHGNFRIAPFDHG